MTQTKSQQPLTLTLLFDREGGNKTGTESKALPFLVPSRNLRLELKNLDITYAREVRGLAVQLREIAKNNAPADESQSETERIIANLAAEAGSVGKDIAAISDKTEEIFFNMTVGYAQAYCDTKALTEAQAAAFASEPYSEFWCRQDYTVVEDAFRKFCRYARLGRQADGSVPV